MAGQSARRGGVCACLFVCAYLCAFVLGSARPAHLNPVPSNPPARSQLTSSSVQGPNPHILQSSPGHKVPFCPPPASTPRFPSCALSPPALCHLRGPLLSLFLADSCGPTTRPSSGQTFWDCSARAPNHSHSTGSVPAWVRLCFCPAPFHSSVES